MPELPKLEVVCEVLNRRLPGQTITWAEVIPPGGPIVVRDLTGAGFGSALTGARFDTIFRRGKFLVLTLLPPDSHDPAYAGSPIPPHIFLTINPKLTGRARCSDLHGLWPWLLPCSCPKRVHVVQREVVLCEMKPESARLGKFQHPIMAKCQPGLFYSPKPPAGLGRVVAKSCGQAIQRDARVIQAPVQPPPTRYLTGERHAQGNRRAAFARGANPALEIERVKHEPVRQV